jgi:DNA-binding response OmpR family regulator
MKTIELPPVQTRLANPSRALTPGRMLRRQLREVSAIRERPKVLIVEDNPDLTLALGLRMRDQGFAVVCAAGRIEAIRVAMEQRPDAIVLDLGLPDGTGFDVMFVVRNIATLAGTPIFIVSGWDENSYASRAQEFEIARYFTKPVDSGHLVRAIRDVLDN